MPLKRNLSNNLINTITVKSEKSPNLRDRENKEKKTCQQLVYEIILDTPVKPTLQEQQTILSDYHKKYGLYKGFIKYHFENGGHQHLILYLIDKPKIILSELNNYFTFDKYKPKTVNLSKMTKTKSALKKFIAIVNYVCDGHDNGKYDNTANYKYDPEIEQCTDIEGKAICWYSRGLKTKEILSMCNWSEKYKIVSKRPQLIKAAKMIKQFQEDYVSEYEMLLPVQEQILKVQEASKPGREVIIIVDKAGDSGKTALGKHIRGTIGSDNAEMYPNAKSLDISAAYFGQENVIFNFPKGTDPKKVNCEIIEHMLDGEIFDGKYHSAQLNFNQKNKVMVFTNKHFNYGDFSKDRVKVYEISDHKDRKKRKLIPYVIGGFGDPLNPSNLETDDYNSVELDLLDQKTIHKYTNQYNQKITEMIKTKRI